MKNKLLEQCKEYFKSKEFKSDFKETIEPIIHYIIQDIYLYILIFILFILLTFIIHLGILYTLYRYNKKITKLILNNIK
jgi:hypothetical protein